jgi:hypothetical protein
MSAELPEAVFARVSRTGVIAGLSGPQLALAALGLARPMWELVASSNLPGALGALLWWTTPLVVLACGSWRGRSFLERVNVMGLFSLRQVLGQTRAVVRVGAQHRAGAIAVPGALGDRLTTLDMVGTAFGGAFLWDQVTQEATVVLRVTTEGWPLAAPAQQSGRARGLSDLCQRLASVEGICRVVKHSRTYPVPPLSAPVGAAGALVRVDAEELAEHPAMQTLRGRDEVITMTLDARAVAAEIDAAGGGIEGLSWALGDRVGQVVLGLPECGVRTQDATWWSAGQIRAAVRLAFDPDAAGLLAESGWSLDDGAVIASVADERYDHLVTDTAVHRTLWVETWPSIPARAGFLSNLVATGTITRTFTQMWCPGQVYSAEKRLLNAEASHNSATAVNTKLGRPAPIAHTTEGKELRRRRRELEAGYADVRHSGWITLTAADVEELRAAEMWVRSTARGLGLKTLRGDQWAAFCTAALPLGIGPRA